MAGNISTRAGDKGPTDIGGGERVDKDDVRVECLGDLDEANSAIGLLRSKLENEHPWVNGLLRIQTEMMNLMAHVGKRPSILQLVNRLSDLFFKLCRQESEPVW
jgi:ATP:cob(I)alamin adenosyltransferase